MNTKWTTRPWMLLAAGFAMGLLLAAGVGGGYWLGRSSQRSPVDLLLEAGATHGSETFAVATGPVGDNMEGVFFLDFLTGELNCWVLNSRTGKWGGLFKANVVQSLGVERGKKPNYLMVTGAASFRGSNVANNLGNCVCYVVDANSGNVAAFAVPWNRQAENAGAGQSFPMVLMATGKARNLNIQE